MRVPTQTPASYKYIYIKAIMQRLPFIIMILSLSTLLFNITNANNNNNNNNNNNKNKFNVDTSSIFHSQGTDSSNILPYGAISNKCYMNLNVEWVVESDSSIYTTPIIDRIYGHHDKHILLTTFSRFLEIIDHRGNRPPIGWPIEFTDHSKFHTSPFVYDIDQDGIDEFGASNNDGIIRFIRMADGIHLSKYDIKVPKLKVFKDWHMHGEEHSNDNDKNNDNKNYNILNGIYYSNNDISNINVNVKQNVKQKNNNFKNKKVASFHYFHDDDLDDLSDDIQNEKNQVVTNVIVEDGEHVLIDPHILGTPLIGYNLTGNNHDFIVVPISFYFTDKKVELFEKIKNEIRLENDKKTSTTTTKLENIFLNEFNPSNYIAGGIGTYDLYSKKWIWMEHLDLTTSHANLKAYIYSSPTVADLNGDGTNEIIVGTSLGLLYVLNALNGETIEGFPIDVGGAIESGIAIADLKPLNDGGNLELFVVDGSGMANCFDWKGKVIWQQTIGGMSTAIPAIGDMNDDGLLDIAFGTTSGHIWALKGTDGTVFNYFPFRTGQRIVAPVVLSDLKNLSTIAMEKKEGLRRSLHIIVPSLDGYIYIIDTISGCTNKVDITEHVYAMIVVDDINNDGYMDLIIGTMNGNIYSIKTEGSYHPLKTSQQIGLGKNHFTYRDQYHGIYFTEDTVNLNQVLGQYVELSFEIVDNRMKYIDENTSKSSRIKPSYKISIYIGSRSTFNKNLKLIKTYYEGNKQYTEYIDMQDVEEENEPVVYIRMENEHGEIFFDSMHLKYYNINLLHHNTGGSNNSISFTLFIVFVILQMYLTCLFSSLNKSDGKFLESKSN